MPDRGEERRQDGRLTNEDIEAIARRAAEIAAPTAAKIVQANFTLQSERSPLESFYMSVGLAVLRSLFGSGFKIGSSSKNGKHNGFGRTKS